MRCYLTLLVFYFAAQVLGGCVTKANGVNDVPSPVFRVGTTRMRDVIAVWGNPDSLKGRTAVWKAWRSTGGKLKASYMMVGMTIESTRVASCEYRLTFSQSGILSDVKVLEAVPGGAKWTLLPW